MIGLYGNPIELSTGFPLNKADRFARDAYRSFRRRTMDFIMMERVESSSFLSEKILIQEQLIRFSIEFTEKVGKI